MLAEVCKLTSPPYLLRLFGLMKDVLVASMFLRFLLSAFLVETRSRFYI